MSLARWDPLNELRRMREDFDRFFGMAPNLAMAPWAAEGITPQIDVFESDNNIVVKANLPGLKRENIEVTATEDSISLSGEFKREEATTEGGYHRRERQVGKFFRTIPMPAAIKSDDVKASFKDGVLEVTAPRAEEARAKEKKVAIET